MFVFARTLRKYGRLSDDQIAALLAASRITADQATELLAIPLL